MSALSPAQKWPSASDDATGPPAALRCPVCFVLAAACAALSLCLLYMTVGSAAGSASTPRAFSTPSSNPVSCDSLSACAQAVDEVCHLAYGNQTYVVNSEISDHGESCNGRCSNGAPVDVVCVNAKRDVGFPTSDRE